MNRRPRPTRSDTPDRRETIDPSTWDHAQGSDAADSFLQGGWISSASVSILPSDSFSRRPLGPRLIVGIDWIEDDGVTLSHELTFSSPGMVPMAQGDVLDGWSSEHGLLRGRPTWTSRGEGTLTDTTPEDAT